MTSSQLFLTQSRTQIRFARAVCNTWIRFGRILKSGLTINCVEALPSKADANCYAVWPVQCSS